MTAPPSQTRSSAWSVFLIFFAPWADFFWRRCISFCRGRPAAKLAWPWACRALAACIVLDGPSAWGQVGTIAAAGIAGLLWFKPGRGTEQESLAIFAPSFLLVFGALPFWEQLRRHVRTQAVLDGINAAVVGLLLAALYQPV